MIPYLGPWISGAVSVLVALLAVDSLKALQVIILFIIVYQVESNLVRPLVMGWAVKVDPLLVIIAVVVGAEALGLIGATLDLTRVEAAPMWDEDDDTASRNNPKGMSARCALGELK